MRHYVHMTSLTCLAVAAVIARHTTARVGVRLAVFTCGAVQTGLGLTLIDVCKIQYIIFFCGCVPEMFVTPYSITHCIYVPVKKREFVYIIIVQFMMSANSRMRFALQIVLVCLYSTPSHYHHCANLSEDIEFIKCQSDIFCRVCELF